LLARLSNTLPGVPVCGGVTEPGAWNDTESTHGAVWVGGGGAGCQVHVHGAVGCLLHSPLGVRHVLTPGCRPVTGGEVMTVTEAVGSTILALDGRPIHDSVRGRVCVRSLTAGCGVHVARTHV
jgi:small ligand-binding sensory domain FIST